MYNEKHFFVIYHRWEFEQKYIYKLLRIIDNITPWNIEFVIKIILKLQYMKYSG